MLHLTGKRMCSCGRWLTVCIHADALPEPEKVYTIRCPLDACSHKFRAGELLPAETCPPDALGRLRPPATNQLKQSYRLAKFIAAGVVSLLLGFTFIVSGDVHSIVAGSGALLAGIVILAFFGWMYASGGGADADMLEQESPMRLVWLGVAITFTPGLLCFYFRFAMSTFDPFAVIFLSVPLLIAGLGCIGIGLWQSNKR